MYLKDPIQEALCEFKFRSPNHGWAVIPGQMYERLQAEYPAEPELEGHSRGLQMTQAGGVSTEIVFGQGPPGVRLQSADGTRLVRIFQGAVSVHMLSPYPQWPAFRDALMNVLDAVSAVAADEIDVERIGVRYINRVEGLKEVRDISEYFIVRPLEFPGVEVSLTNFLGRAEYRFGPADSRRLIATFASTESVDQSPAYMLDLDLIAEGLENVCSVAAALEIASELRNLERDVFEASITDTARKAFGGYTEVPLE